MARNPIEKDALCGPVCDRDPRAGGGAHGEPGPRDRRFAETTRRYRTLGRSLQACRSRPRFFGSIQCSMDFEMIRGSKNCVGATRTPHHNCLRDANGLPVINEKMSFTASISFGRLLLLRQSLVKIFLHQSATESIRARESQDVVRTCRIGPGTGLTQKLFKIPMQ